MKNNDGLSPIEIAEKRDLDEISTYLREKY